ncbi:hypothetical protein EYF80_012857 [Liparis tanakae]|uniref:Uncharacterized protein n=1 Tax=Liparis tanakae TaxID=230148 RepID=A0A4Z2IH13_9TELE|nr:hypothetical protein EYF80_012857 [Liparis tanakae]
MSYISAPKLHQSTARLCPLLIRISGALRKEKGITTMQQIHHTGKEVPVDDAFLVQVTQRHRNLGQVETVNRRSHTLSKPSLTSREAVELRLHGKQPPPEKAQ